MMLALLIATIVQWITLPNDKSPDGYVGWRLDEQRIIELDSKLVLPEGAYPREAYVRYYAGHIAPDGTKTLKVAFVHARPSLFPPAKYPIKPGIYINYTAKGRAFVPSGFHSGCLLITGEFDAQFRPTGPFGCSNEFVVHPPTEDPPPKP